MTNIEAIKLALDALHNHQNTLMFLVPSCENKMRQATLAGGGKAIAALRTAIASNSQAISKAEQADHIGEANEMVAEQEPVAWFNWNEAKFEWLTEYDYHKHHMKPLYLAPPQREWVSPCRPWQDLTDDEIEDAYMSDEHENTPKSFARAIEAKLKENNCGAA